MPNERQIPSWIDKSDPNWEKKLQYFKNKFPDSYQNLTGAQVESAWRTAHSSGEVKIDSNGDVQITQGAPPAGGAQLGGDDFLRPQFDTPPETMAPAGSDPSGDRDQNYGLRNNSTQPEYFIPDEIFDIVDKYNKASSELIDSARKDKYQSLSDIQLAGQQRLGTLTSTRDKALGYAEDEISRLRDIQDRTRKQSLNEAYGARRDALQSLDEGGDRALDLMRLQAFGGLPGDRLTREQMQADFASTRQDVRERAGGGGAGLGAIVAGQTGQQGMTRQLGIDRANYQAAGVQNLAEGELTQSGRMAEAQLKSGMDIADLQRNLGQEETRMGLDTSKYYTDMVGQYGKDIADAKFDTGRYMADTRLRGGQQYSNALQLGTAMQGSALGTLANYRDQQYKYNQLDPYLRERQLMINEMRRLDPFQSEMDYWGGMAGMGYNETMAGRQGYNVGANNQWNAVSDMLGTTANAAMLYGWAGGYQGGNELPTDISAEPPPVDYGNQYDYNPSGGNNNNPWA